MCCWQSWDLGEEWFYRTVKLSQTLSIPLELCVLGKTGKCRPLALMAPKPPAAPGPCIIQRDEVSLAPSWPCKAKATEHFLADPCGLHRFLLNWTLQCMREACWESALLSASNGKRLPWLWVAVCAMLSTGQSRCLWASSLGMWLCLVPCMGYGKKNTYLEMDSEQQLNCSSKSSKQIIVIKGLHNINWSVERLHLPSCTHSCKVCVSLQLL